MGIGMKEEAREEGMEGVMKGGNVGVIDRDRRRGKNSLLAPSAMKQVGRCYTAPRQGGRPWYGFRSPLSGVSLTWVERL